MADDNDTSALLGEFAAFMKARQDAAAADTDPDNERDVAFTAADGTSMTLPWRKARDFDIDGLLESKFGLKRKATAGGDTGDASSSDGAGKTKPGKPGGQGSGTAGATVQNLFRGGKPGQQKTG